MIDQRLVNRADELITKGEGVLRAVEPNRSVRPIPGGFGPDVTDRTMVDYTLWAQWRSQSFSFLQRTLGESDPYVVEFAERCQSRNVSGTKAGIGILQAVKQDLEGGHLARLSELVRADVFSDFLEMAEYLLSEGFKDPAAVLGGGVLEEHLRQLCDKHGVPTSVGSKPKTINGMNDDLAKAGAYDKNQKSIVTSWAGTRNSAAHGQYTSYTDGVVERFLAGLREFIARFPA